MRDVLYVINYVFLTLLLQSYLGNGYTNIALNKNATQVSTRLNTFKHFGPRNANDGKRNQNALNGDCSFTHYADPDIWWTIDFGNMYTIESVSIYGSTDCCLENHSNFEIRIHNTSDWSSHYSLRYKQIGPAPTEFYVNCTDHISGKYLTVYKKDEYSLTLCEVEVYGTEVIGNTVNTYKSKPTTLGTTLIVHKTHENNVSTSFDFHDQTTECNGWDFVYYNGLCMLFIAIDLNWFEARTYCENKNSHLLVLDSEQKVNETKELLNTYYHDLRSLYVGASDETKEGEWKWVSNTSGYFNFQPGQPNNIDSNHPNKVANCGAVMSKGQLDLYDVYCYGKRQFICEM